MTNGPLMERKLVVFLLRGLGLLVLAGILLAVLWVWQGPLIRSWLIGKGPGETLDVFGAVPDFSLIERNGKPVRRDDLMGKVWIATFIYTRCPDTCLLQTTEMAKLQSALTTEDDLRLVSITVDPERDTPAVLSQYANRYGADANRWLFLTGEKEAIYRLAREGFRLSVVDPEKQVRRRLFAPSLVSAHDGETEKLLLHSSRFVLVDRQARIRGYYQSNDEKALQRLRRDVRILLREER